MYIYIYISWPAVVTKNWGFCVPPFIVRFGPCTNVVEQALLEVDVFAAGKNRTIKKSNTHRYTSIDVRFLCIYHWFVY